MRDASLDEFLGSEVSDEDEERESSGGASTDTDTDTDADADTDSNAETPPADDSGQVDRDAERGERADEETEVEAEADAEPSADTPADSLTVRPATVTYDWSPDGAACAACGTVVEARWHDPDVGMVCPDCKAW
jgi:hypothetical protein